MAKKECKEKKLEMTGSEIIITTINDVVNNAIKYETENGDDHAYLETLIECSDLLSKLLYFNYFKESDECSDKLFKENTNNNFNNWYKAYNKSWRNKKKDIKKLYKLILSVQENL